MPRIKLTKSAIDALPPPKSDVVYWDAASPGFGVKVTPKGRKVFVVLYRIGGAGSKLRKYTIGPYGRVTLHQARVAAQKVFAAKLEGRDPAAEKREAKRRIVADWVEDLLEAFIAQRLSQNRSAAEISRLLRREVGKPWAGVTHEASLNGTKENAGPRIGESTVTLQFRSIRIGDNTSAFIQLIPILRLSDRLLPSRVARWT